MAEEKYVQRFKTKYNDEVRAKLIEQFGYTNPMTVPQIEKIVVNMGVGEAATDSKAIDGAVADLRRDPPYPRLPRHLRQELRRPW